MTWHFTFAYWSHLVSWVWFGFSSWPQWRWEGLNQCISPCYVSLSCPWVSTGQTRKYPRKDRCRTVFALLSSARWLIEDQEPQRGEAPDSCILFPLNINTPVRQMRLQLPPPLPQLHTALLQRPEFTQPGGTSLCVWERLSPNVITVQTEAVVANDLEWVTTYNVWENKAWIPLSLDFFTQFTGCFALALSHSIVTVQTTSHSDSSGKGQVLQLTITHWYPRWCVMTDVPQAFVELTPSRGNKTRCCCFFVWCQQGGVSL